MEKSDPQINISNFNILKIRDPIYIYVYMCIYMYMEKLIIWHGIKFYYIRFLELIYL